MAAQTSAVNRAESPRDGPGKSIASPVWRLARSTTLLTGPAAANALGPKPGALAGSQMRLCAGGRGIEATLIIPEDAARSGVELALAELTKVLKSRGVPISHCEVVTRDQQRQRDPREQRERQRSQFEAGGDAIG